MRPSQKQEQDQPEQDVEEEIVVVEEAIIFVEKNGKQGRGVHHHHQQEQQEEEEEHQQHDDESPPPSSRSRRFQDQSNSDYVDDEEEDREEEDGARRRGEDGEDEYIDRRSWRQEPEAEMEAEHEQQQEEQEQEQEMELDDEAGEQGAGAGRARSGEEEVGSNIRGGGAKSEAPYSKLYIKIAQSDLYAEQHKAFDEKWGAVDADDEEKWVQGGDDLVKKAKGVLDRVRDHVMERMKLYTTIDTHIVEHKSELVSNATTLDATASQLSSWGNHIVSSVNIGGDGKQPSSSA
ncbi:hypothetical protein BDY24DRAFT_399384 [Mrakia frigida]|uniref:uncharacterized protein n=1 Tax=Mrakia frigida TaxID=29902 RepID=UPI003FCC15C1